ncbi:MAG: hypothetical protein JXA69_05825, partial [Phycisphaerae bacterium]|nr:hypothetical protein [Phycisphaerae bacterium]
GAVSLALRSARRAAGDKGNLVWIEPAAGCDGLYPPALVQAGVRAQQVVVVRPASLCDAAWACDQALRCRGVSAVLFFAGRKGRFDQRSSRLFQLAAEQGRTVGLLVRPFRPAAGAAGHSSRQIRVPDVGEAAFREAVRTFAAVQLWTECVDRPAGCGGRLCRICVLKTREGRPVEPVWVEWGDETGDVSVHAVAGRRASNAPGQLATA